MHGFDLQQNTNIQFYSSMSQDWLPLDKNKVAENSTEVTPERVIDICLDHVGALSIHKDTRSKLIEYANEKWWRQSQWK